MVRGLSRCSTCALLLRSCGVLVPQPGTEPALPALQGGPVALGPPGSPHAYALDHL